MFPEHFYLAEHIRSIAATKEWQPGFPDDPGLLREVQLESNMPGLGALIDRKRYPEVHLRQERVRPDPVHRDRGDLREVALHCTRPQVSLTC